MNDELERTGTETVLANFQIPQHIPSDTNEHDETSQFLSCSNFTVQICVKIFLSLITLMWIKLNVLKLIELVR
jgi:hypothetical protein